jgi:hypothetical protein
VEAVPRVVLGERPRGLLEYGVGLVGDAECGAICRRISSSSTIKFSSVFVICVVRV